MRKRVAGLLTIIMLLSSLSAISVSAAPLVFDTKYNYQLVSDQGLLDGEDGIELNNSGLSTNEAGVKWDMKQSGVYTLSYYVEQSGITNKVNLEFDVNAAKKVKLKATVSNTFATPPTYSYRQYNAGTWNWETKAAGTPVFEYEDLHLDAIGAIIPFDRQQLSLQAGALPIRLMIKGQTIHVSTEGVEAGNITEFKLQYYNGLTVEEGSLKTIKGLKNFRISPTHLTPIDGFTSKELLKSGEEELGSHPGVKVDFDKPKVIQGDNFAPVTGNDIKAVLNMWVSTSATGGNNVNSSNGITLKFPLSATPTTPEPITDEMGVVNGQVRAIGSTMSINVNNSLSYVDPAIASQVVKWDKLDASMLIGVGLTLEGGVIDELPAEKKQFNLENNGHTYLQYTVFRASESQVGIRIIPYNINGAVTYTLKQGATQTSLVKSIDHYYPNRKDNTEPIYIYIPNIGSERFYQIEADIGAGETLKSQIMQFQIANETAPPTVPRIQSINNIYAVPSHEIGGQPQAVGFDIEWQAPPKDELDVLLSKGSIYYELSLHKVKKENRTPGDSAVIKIFKVSKVNGDIKITTEAGTTGVGRYISATGTFAVEGVVAKHITQAGWEYIQVNDARFAGVDYLVGTAATMDAYHVPGIYYASINAIFDPTFDPQNPLRKVAQSQDSSDVSVSIDNVNEIIPVPTELESINRSIVNETEQAINYDIEIQKVNIRDYVKMMLTPAELYLDATNSPTYKGTYEIFLYQKNDKKQIYTDQDLKNAIATTGSAITLTTTNNLVLNNTQLDDLRNGKIIPIVYPIESLEGQLDRVKVAIQNMDPNQVYYVKVRVRLNTFKNLQPHDLRYSIFSKTLSFTTTSLPQPPKPEDKVPPVPEKFWVDSQPNNTTAILKWAEAKFNKDEDTEKVYYEIARVVDAQLKESERSNKLDIEKLITMNSSLVGFNTSESNIMTIGGTQTTWQQLQPVQSSDAFKLDDLNLSPNTIYYYYIRTVCIIKGVAVRSEWIMVPVTTHPVEKPIKLQVEVPSKYNYNPKTETVISFLAPIPAGAAIPSQYEFEIAIQSEMENTYRLDYNKVALTSLEDPSLITSGYRHFVYKIYDLKPGKRYDIKVRIVDKTNAKPENADYPRSLYSERVVARTEFDQDDQDKDNKFAEYLKRYDDEVEKLRRRSYWEVEGDNRFSAAYKYRQSYINAEIAVQNIYELQTNKDMNRLTYYLPADMLSKASDFNVVISAVLGNESVNVRPYTLTLDNKDIKEAISQVGQKRIADYYIKLDFFKMASSAVINGERVISPEICVDMDIVYLETEDMLIEDDIMIELNNLIDKERKHIITLLEKELLKGKINDEILKDIIDDAVQAIRKDHQKDVRGILKRETYKTVSIKEIEKPILLTSILESYSVNGYYLEGSWSSVEVIQANGGFAIEAHKLGIYVFTGSQGIGSALPELIMYQNIISKYNLTDFFTLDAYMIKTGATKKQVYGAIARVLGAKRNTDYMLYLKNRGIKGITSVGTDKVIRQDEAVYILMQAYEKIYNKPITAISIKNKQSISNIGAFQAHYRNYAYAAVELKVIQNPNAIVLPSKLISAEEMIQMLSKIVPR